MSNKLKGKSGEDLAADFLLNGGFKILERNFRYSRCSEIDIIAKKDDILYFIEVKYRTYDAFGFPLEAITKSKLEKIKAGASYYLSNTKEKFKSYRISAVSILGSKINFIENILF